MANSQVSASRTEGLRSFLHKLREASPEEFASTATSGACVDLGFTKAMFSWVDGTSWRPESVYISPDLDDRFDALIDAVDGSAVPLLRAPREADLVRYRRPYVLGKESYRQAYRPLIDLSRPSAYAAAPILAGGRTVAILHVDRHTQQITDDDLELLFQGAHLCGLTYATLDARRRLLDQRRAFAAALDLSSSSSSTADARDHFSPFTGIHDAPGFDTATHRLTEREEAVLGLLASGASNRIIGEQLFISEGTVKTHVRHLFRKLDVRTRAEAAAYAHSRRPARAACAV
ncbi:helix-turn-helix transcriptional regulator [Gordonia polyisoprenivorans]|uniref:helix-turn-helix transcriptional regulator n=1 Tax=Gordonia polyisoprenivorans TaxID=84595 RepID=UPI002301A2B7|nr:LuxR C-terminal-related transcriptional regulator [Gordonia polyisoprenivorans]WCB38925.1 LuxR C-terminal-related transcriptional regulator [Gordonia polyisoprenivorans]